MSFIFSKEFLLTYLIPCQMEFTQGSLHAYPPRDYLGLICCRTRFWTCTDDLSLPWQDIFGPCRVFKVNPVFSVLQHWFSLNERPSQRYILLQTSPALKQITDKIPCTAFYFVFTPMPGRCWTNKSRNSSKDTLKYMGKKIKNEYDTQLDLCLNHQELESIIHLRTLTACAAYPSCI